MNSEIHHDAENIVLSVFAGLSGLTIAYAVAVDVIGLDRSVFHSIYVISLAFSLLSLGFRVLNLRRSGVEILFVRFPAAQPDGNRRIFAWLFSAAAMGAYSVYRVVMEHESVFLVNCVVSNVLMVVSALSLARTNSGSGPTVDESMD